MSVLTGAHRFHRKQILQGTVQLQLCLLHPPAGDAVINDVQETLLEITEEVSVRSDSGPKVVVVNNSFVAKIYDPLFYPAYYGIMDICDFTNKPTTITAEKQLHMQSLMPCSAASRFQNTMAHGQPIYPHW